MPLADARSLLEEFRSDWTASDPRIAACAADPVHWLEHYGKTYDPRLLPGDPFIPFRPFPRQVDFLRWLQEREAAAADGLAEKSRDMGLTWLCVAYAVHGWLFRPGFAAGFGSRKLELVDRIGDPSSIFEKIRILLRNQPEWLMPAGWSPKEHDNHCRILNPATGATITGEGGDEIGRGGRTTIYFVDEAAFLEKPQRVEASLSQTTQCRIWVSTPNGPGNIFYQKRHGGKVPVFTFHWRDDPRKGATWYAREKARLDPVTLASEVDIDYTASVEGICIPAKWVRAAVGLPLPEGRTCIAGLDVAEEGRNRSVFIARRGPVIRAGEITDWGQALTTETAWRARDECRRVGATILKYDCIGVGAGVKGTLETSEEPLGFWAAGINVGAAPTDAVWPNGKTSREQFLNLRAELWWRLRARFEKAYQYRLYVNGEEGGVERPADEMISIPDHPQLIADLSLPLHFRTDTGKIKIEGKNAMARRGVKSPDFAEALLLTEAPDPDDNPLAGLISQGSARGWSPRR